MSVSASAVLSLYPFEPSQIHQRQSASDSISRAARRLPLPVFRKPMLQGIRSWPGRFELQAARSALRRAAQNLFRSPACLHDRSSPESASRGARREFSWDWQARSSSECRPVVDSASRQLGDFQSVHWRRRFPVKPWISAFQRPSASIKTSLSPKEAMRLRQPQCAWWCSGFSSSAF